MRYYKYYKIMRTANPTIKASRVLEYIKQLGLAGNIDKAFK